jgi:S1-C subfamily serine protease
MKIKFNLPYLTPSELLKFINIEPINRASKTGVFKLGQSVSLKHLSLWDFLKNIPSRYRDDQKYNSEYSSTILSIANKLTSIGLLSPIPGKVGLFQEFQGNGYNAELASYGYYEFLIYGFPFIIDHFKDAIRVIEVQDLKTKDYTVGTGFAIIIKPDRTFFVTAKHCLPKGNKINIRIFLPEKKFVSPKHIYVHPDENIDIALLEFSEDNLISDHFFQLKSHQLLDDIVVAGYPSIPGSTDAILVASKGEITAVAKTYLHKYEQIYVNANVKGGSSGSPIISSTGYVIGVIIESPRDTKNNDLQDELRFGTGLPCSLIEMIAGMIIAEDKSLKKLNFKNNEDGSFYMT